MSFEEKIREWVALDNHARMLNDELRRTSDNRNAVGRDLFRIAGEKNMENAVVEITDGRLKLQRTRIAAPLTLKYVLHSLKNCMGEQEVVNHIMNYLKTNRDTKYVSEVKRSYTSK